MPLVENVKRCMKEHGEQCEEIARLRVALKEIADMKPSEITPGLVHGPALLLGNCQRLARRVLRKKA